MQVQLIVTDKQKSGQAIPVNAPAFRIGQAEDCHLRSNSSRISPQHCVLHTHGDTVTILDLGSENGTYVNGERITSQQKLKDGDKFTVGRHSFILSIKAGVVQSAASQGEVFELADDSATKTMSEQNGAFSVSSDEATAATLSNAESEQDAEVMFEVRYKGQNVSVTKTRLFEMARKGAVSPDDIITVAGTKVFADSVHGIVFGNESAANISTTDSEAQDSKPYVAAAGISAHDPFESFELEESATDSHSHDASIRPDDSAVVEGSTPFDTASEPSVQIDRVPGARKEMTFSDLGKSLEEPLEQASTWMNNNITRRHVVIAGSILAACCLLGALVFFLIPDEKSSYGAVRITGTLTLDGKPVAGAGVILHPRNEHGHAARGATDSRGRFVVGTGTDSPGRGAVPGEYIVTFRKPEIPSRYEVPETSELTLVVEPRGRNSFNFAVSSAAEIPRNVAPQGVAGTATSPPTADTRTETEISSPHSSFSDIWAAAARGTIEDVEFFIETGTNANARNDTGDTPLHNAAALNPDVAVLRYLVAQDTNVNARNDADQTPWDVANTDEKRHILREAGATPPPPTRPTFTDIWAAAARGTLQDIETFVRAGVGINERDDAGNTPLHHAARFNNENVVRTLARGADGYARNNAGQTPLDVANTAAKRRILLDALTPPPPHIRNIIDAAARGTAQHVEFFVRRDRADVNQRDGSNQLGNRVLHVAAESNADVAVLEYLIAQGADVNAGNNTANTPLHFAARNNPNMEIMRHLIDRGADVNASNEVGRTPWDVADTSEKRVFLFREGGRGSGGQ